MHPIAGGVCSICGERVISAYAVCASDGGRLGGLCQRMQPSLVKAAGYKSYHGGLRELIHLLKYEQVKPTANVLGRMLAETIRDLKASFGSTEMLVLPVPFDGRQLRQRGFNQAEMITRAALKLKPAGEQLTLNAAALWRCRETQSQIGLTHHQRRQNMRGAFTVVEPAEVDGREILLIDDVFMTGATVSECARVLRRAGATRVYVATVARTLKTDAAYTICAEEKAENGKASEAMAAYA